MSKDIRRIDVVFKDPAATYKAGDVVSGRVYIEVAQECKIKAIKLHLQGISRVHWDEQRAYTKGSASHVSHKNVDVYLDEPIILTSKGGTFAGGRYDWPFTVRLPGYLPASFEGQYGRVQYWAKVTIERPWSKQDMDWQKNFTVLGTLDLNAEPDAKAPVENKGETMAGAFCCKSGPITGHILLTRRAFVPPQNIPFSAVIKNMSKRKFSVRVTLSQCASFRADKELRKSSTLLKAITQGEVKAGESLEWEDEMKNIPPLPPTKLGGGCKHIDVRYILKLVCVPSGPGAPLEVPVEVLIGTIPFRKTEPGQAMLTVKAAAKEGGLGVVNAVKGRSPRPSPMISRAADR